MERINYFKTQIHKGNKFLVHTNHKGEQLPLQVALNDTYEVDFNIMSPRTLCHDITEHLNHPQWIGGVADEFEAMGAMLALRPVALTNGLIPEIELILSDWFMRHKDWGYVPNKVLSSTKQFRELFGVYTDWNDLSYEYPINNAVKEHIQNLMYTGYRRAIRVWRLPKPQKSIAHVSEQLLDLSSNILEAMSEGELYKIVTTHEDITVFLTMIWEPRKFEQICHAPYWN